MDGSYSKSLAKSEAGSLSQTIPHPGTLDGGSIHI